MTFISARPGRPALYMQSPFTAEMAPALGPRQARAYSPALFLGLLEFGPDADGYGAVELQEEGYARQQVELVSRSASHLTIPRPVLFGISGLTVVRALGLFTADGHVEAYGAIRSSRPGPGPASRIEFASHQIMVKRVDR